MYLQWIKAIIDFYKNDSQKDAISSSVMSILVIDMHIVKVYRSEVRYWIHKWYYYLTLDKGF